MATIITSAITASSNAAETRRRKAILMSKLKELLGGSRQRDELVVDYAADPVDQIRSSTDREVVIQQLDRQTRLMHEIQSALSKIEDGQYGLCERCEEPIPSKRLDAVPWARLCVPCQYAEEVAERKLFPEAA